jgi:gamma-glutamyltranspeptidase
MAYQIPQHDDAKRHAEQPRDHVTHTTSAFCPAREQPISAHPTQSTTVDFLILIVAVPSGRAGPEPVRARTGLVISASAIASEVGAHVLKDGGTAIDAAVATAFALAVTHPVAGNIAGGCAL